MLPFLEQVHSYGKRKTIHQQKPILGRYFTCPISFVFHAFKNVCCNKTVFRFLFLAKKCTHTSFLLFPFFRWRCLLYSPCCIHHCTSRKSHHHKKIQKKSTGFYGCFEYNMFFLSGFLGNALSCHAFKKPF